MSTLLHILIAYTAGVLSFFAPCGTFLLPAFFTYAFKERGSLIRATWIFLLGFMSLFVPVGLGIHWIASTLALHREGLAWVGGSFMLILAAMALFGVGPHVAVPTSLTKTHEDHTAPLSIYIFGLAFGFTLAGCTAPLLAVSLALAGTSGNFVSASLILAGFVVGLGTPLLALAFAADRSKMLNSRIFKAQSVRISLLGYEVWVSPVNVISAVVLAALGIFFIVSQGTFYLSSIARNPWLLDFNVNAANFLSRLR